MAAITRYPDVILPARARIMIVDDEPIIVKRLATLLDQLGYAVTAFTDSEEALSALARERFDLIVTDLKMRKIDGLKMLETALANDPEARVLVITGDGSWESISGALGKGARGFILKPFRIEELKIAIDRVMLPGLSADWPAGSRFTHNTMRNCDEKNVVNI